MNENYDLILADDPINFNEWTLFTFSKCLFDNYFYQQSSLFSEKLRNSGHFTLHFWSPQPSFTDSYSSFQVILISLL